MNSINNKKLIIVESPTKAKTISNFLNKNFEIEASYGHVRDLPKNKLGINIENNFQPQYIIPLKFKKRINLLKKKVKKFKEIILATDEDREGEAIAWHLKEVLNLNEKNIKRIVFHEITKDAILKSLEKPKSINLNLVNAQQARRILDRLVGYLLSPFLWKKITKGLSAGRVQSVALKIIADREKEIKNFIPQKYFSIKAILENEKKQIIESILFKINNKKINTFNFQEIEEIEKDLNSNIFFIIIEKIEKKEIKKNPPPPFITSTLQQEAFKKLKISSKNTMFLAQELYEKGLITYIRTDSFNLSQQFLNQCHLWIKNNLNKNYHLKKINIFKNKSKSIQEAHEAIRPTNINLIPELLKKEKNKFNLKEKNIKLYQLIWQRIIATQLPQAIFHSTNIKIKYQTNKNIYHFKTTGYILKFDGFLKFWPQKFKENILPNLKENEKLNLIKIKKQEHLTEPPSRYNEASLIKTLEKYGIGRPSTYSPIISIIQKRNYVQKDENKKFQITELGNLVNETLTKHFSKIIDINFTASMEEKLDKIAQGKINWVKVIKNFYIPFSQNLEKKYKEVLKEDVLKEILKEDVLKEEIKEKCEKCNSFLITKFSKYGKFLACKNFPQCKFIKSLKKNNYLIIENKKITCLKCQNGFILIKKTKKGKIFYACENYPNCDFATWQINNLKS